MPTRGLRPLLFRIVETGVGRAWQRGFLLCAALLILAGCRSGDFPQYAPDYREYAYVANSGGDTVSVLDLVHLRREAELRVAPRPVALLVSQTRNEVYALSLGRPPSRGVVSVIDAETNRVTARLPAGHAPAALALDSHGDRLYIADAGSNTLSVLDVQARRVLGAVGTGQQPGALAVSPDGGTLVVANAGGASVSLYTLRQGKLPEPRAAFSGCPGAGSLAILPDSSKAFVACEAGRQVMVIGLRRPSPGRTSLASEASDRPLALLDVGQSPLKLVLKPDGGEIFVLNRDSDTMSEIATGMNEVGGAYSIGRRPAGGVVSQDSTLLWVANQAADTVAVYAIDDGKLVNTVHVGVGPGPVAFSSDGHLLLAADTGSGDVSVLRTFDRNLRREPVLGTLFTLLPAGPAPAALAVKAFRLRR